MVLAIKLREVMETMGSLKEKIGLMERDEIITALREATGLWQGQRESSELRKG